MGRLLPALLAALACAARAIEHEAVLHNGVKIPRLGLGCASGVRKEHVSSALMEGYRLLDTAQATVWGYDEAGVGEAVSESVVPRGELFLQTKIFPQDLGYHSTKRAFLKSLVNLNTTWVDSLLLHKPRCWGDICHREPEGTWQDSWRALEELYESGQVRAIGICDVDDQLLDELLAMRADGRIKVVPHIIQNWMDPFHQDTRVRERCWEQGIHYQAYSSLGAQWRGLGHEENPVWESEDLKDLAEVHSCSVAEVVLSWAMAQHAAVIPASRNSARRLANMRSLDLELEKNEIARIATLDGSLDSQSIDVRNTLDVPIEIYWVDDGEETRLDELAPGITAGQATYPGHRFVFKNGEGEVVGEHVVEARGPKYLVTVGAKEEL